jgi:GDP-L-fucose synthase
VLWTGENPFVVWGDGSPIRDLIHSRDVARGMMTVFEKSIRQPINLGSGVGVNIKKIVEIIGQNLETNHEIVWDSSKPAGYKK